TTKVLTTPQAPEEAVIAGVCQVLEEAALRFSDIDVFLHGTTLATNAVIERKGALTALITTEGFRDVLEIADESRYDQYDVFITKPEPLVPRTLRFTVPERVDVEGNELLVLDESAVAAVAQSLNDAGVQAVAIVFLHSYVNPAHEIRAAEIVRQLCPAIEITISSQVCPEAREYERTTTALCNSYVQPLMAGYLKRLKDQLGVRGFAHDVHLMTSGGHLCSLETARQYPIRLVESGPAGGAMLAASLAAERGEAEILSFDMGGTTAKICLIEQGKPLKARLFEIDRRSRFMKGSGIPVRIPVIEMIEIGAGGGSIAQIDAMRRIQVGPQSAGSEPGPASYGLGGEQPTVTDADVLLGKIDPDKFAGGTIALRPDLAEAAMTSRVGDVLSMDATTAAYGIAEMVDENMANAARVHAIERGVAIAGRTLIAFGGAAPLHASRLAEKLGISRVIVPHGAGVGSAIGFLNAPAAYELVQSRYMRLDQFDGDAATSLLGVMSAEASAQAASAAGARPLTESRGAYMRYTGQGHEIYVGLPGADLTNEDVPALREAFEKTYRLLFKRHIPDSGIEIMSWSVLVSTDTAEPERLGQVPDGVMATAVGQRDVFDAGLSTMVSASIYERENLQPGMGLAGPAVVVEPGTSTLISSSFDCRVDASRALVLNRKESYL
ncbi:MAG: hydantoinase/oxoprolinase family protein, partial [Burkholderiaceae bacterium]